MASPWNNRLILNLSQVKRSVLKIQMLQDYRSLNKNTAPPSCSFLSKTARPPSQFGSLPPAPRTTDPQPPVLEGRGGLFDSVVLFAPLQNGSATPVFFLFFFFLRQVWKKKKRGLFIKKRFYISDIKPAVAAFERREESCGAENSNSFRKVIKMIQRCLILSRTKKKKKNKLGLGKVSPYRAQSYWSGCKERKRCG